MTFFSREDEEVAKQVRQALLNGESVLWVSEYETFYGSNWSNWAKEQIKDIPCEIKATGWNSQYDFADELSIIPKK